MSSLFSRMMEASVRRAGTAQPKRIQRTVDEHLYAGPDARPQVEAMARAARMLRQAGFGPGDRAQVAVRRSAKRATVLAPDVELAAVDNRSLTSVDLADLAYPVLRGLRAGAESAVWAYPPYLLALAQRGEVPSAATTDLLAEVGSVVVVDAVASEELAVDDEAVSDATVDTDGGGSEALISPVVVYRGAGVLATGDDPVEAAMRLELAEAVARIDHLARPTGP